MAFPFLPAAIAVGSLVAGAVASKGASDANKANKEEAQRNRDFQERLSNTAYQRGVQDMRAAGLNPALAYQQGGASSPSGGTAQITNALSPLGAGISSAAQAGANIELTRAQAVKTSEEARGQAIDNQKRGDLLDEQIAATGASAEESRSRTALATRQLQELQETWPDRLHMPGTELALKRLEHALNSGTLAQRQVAAQLANDITRANIQLYRTRAEVATALRNIVRPYSDLGEDAAKIIGPILKGLIGRED